jgi:hypothetical protein
MAISGNPACSRPIAAISSLCLITGTANQAAHNVVITAMQTISSVRCFAHIFVIRRFACVDFLPVCFFLAIASPELAA